MRSIAVDAAAQRRWAGAALARDAAAPCDDEAEVAHEAHQAAAWLPLMVYRASWRAERASSAGDGDSERARACSAATASRQLLRRAGRAVSADASQGHWVVSDWDASTCPCLRGLWSDYYAANARTPEVLELAPWVAKRYARLRRAREGRTGTAPRGPSEDGGGRGGDGDTGG